MNKNQDFYSNMHKDVETLKKLGEAPKPLFTSEDFIRFPVCELQIKRDTNRFESASIANAKVAPLQAELERAKQDRSEMEAWGKDQLAHAERLRAVIEQGRQLHEADEREIRRLREALANLLAELVNGRNCGKSWSEYQVDDDVIANARAALEKK